MAETATLTAERRQETGKGAARKMRQAGKIPAVIYGRGRDPEALMVPSVEAEKLIQQAGGGSTLVELSVDGKPIRTLIREVQRHPTRKNVTHLDFMEVHAGEKLKLAVPLLLVGSPDGVRNAGGVLEQFLREIDIEVLPRNIPERIELDVTDLKVGHSLHVSDLSVENAELLVEADTTVCAVVPPRVEEEPVVEVAEEEGVEEPELIRKAKDEEGEAEAESEGEKPEE
jgi:large subunit ribosomal protein L25